MLILFPLKKWRGDCDGAGGADCEGGIVQDNGREWWETEDDWWRRWGREILTGNWASDREIEKVAIQRTPVERVERICEYLGK